ncbi:MAG: hypothetical protein KGO82_16835, partial [Bacteroidota bacterium]|nr:hypothetical protein [Bacteroidota bacterium]
MLAAFAAEKKAVQDSIQEYLDEGEYQFAFWQSRGLLPASQHLDVLQRFADPLFAQRNFLQTRIQHLQRMLGRSSITPLPDYLLNELEKAETELEILERRRVKISNYPQKTVLDERLEELLDKKIRSMTITLSLREPVAIKLNYKNKCLQMRTSGLKKARLEGWFSYYQVQKAANLGFQQLSRSEDMRLLLTGNKETLLEQSKLI